MPRSPLQLAAENEALKRRLAELERRLEAQARPCADMQLFDSGPIIFLKRRNDDAQTTEQITPNVLRQLGYTADDFLKGRVGLAELLHPEDAERVNAALDSALASDQTILRQAPYRLRHREGGTPWFLDTSVLLRDETGAVTQMVSYLLEITDLMETEERWRYAVNNSQEGLWDWNAATDEVFFSDLWKRILGYEPHEIGDSLEEWEERVHPEDMERVRQELTRHLSGEAAHYESVHRLRCKDGSYKWILDRGMVVSRDGAGAPERIIGTHCDLTRRVEAEERFRLLMEFLPEGVMLVDPQTTKVLEFNTAAHQMLGYSREEFAAFHIADFEAVETPEEILDHAGMMRSAGQDDFESLYRKKDGSLLHVAITVKLVEMGGAPRLLTVHRDITEHKRNEATLRQSESQFRTLFQESPTAIIIHDKDTGEIVDANKAAHLSFGLSSVEELRHHDIWLDAPYSGEDALALIHKAAREGSKRFTWKSVARDGTIFWENVFLRPMTINGVERVLATCIDITEQILAEEALRQTMDQLETRVHERTLDLRKTLVELRVAKEAAESASRMKTDFFTSVTHELRTPLHGIQGMLQLLEETALDPEQQDYVGEIKTASRRLLGMVDKVLDVTSLENYQVAPAPTGLRALADYAAHTFGPTAREGGIDFAASIAPDCPEVVLLDMNLIKLMLNGMLGCALKHTEGDRLHLTISTRARNERTKRIDLLLGLSGVGPCPTEPTTEVEPSLYTRLTSETDMTSDIGMEAVRKALTIHGGRLELSDGPEGEQVQTARLRVSYCDDDDLELCFP